MQIGDVWSPNAGISVFNLATSLLPYPTWGVVGLVRVHQRQPFMRDHKPLRGEGGIKTYKPSRSQTRPFSFRDFFSGIGKIWGKTDVHIYALMKGK